MSRLRKVNEQERKQAAVQNMDSPFSDKDCLDILEKAGYGYVLDKTKYDRIATTTKNSGYFGFYCRQALTEKEKETISFTIIYSNKNYLII